MAKTYGEASDKLTAAAMALESSSQPSWPERVRSLTKKEAMRARFEAAELQVMAHQQSAMNDFAHFLNTRSEDVLRRGITSLEQACVCLEVAKSRALEAGIPEKNWYFGNINGWLSKEFKKKIENYRMFLKDEEGP